jgi:magnesium chelatase family protein
MNSAIRLFSATISGRMVQPVTIEIAQSRASLPGVSMLGLPSKEVRESRERIFAALRQSGFKWPHAKITINLQPVQVRKEGSSLDLAVALGLLQLFGYLPIEEYAAFGEISLDGSVLPVPGQYAYVQYLTQRHQRLISPPMVFPAENRGAYKGKWQVLEHLKAIHSLQWKTPTYQPVPVLNQHNLIWPEAFSPSLLTVLELVVAGGHHAFLLGSPGIGKSYSRQVLSNLLPAFSADQWLERLIVDACDSWPKKVERVVTPVPEMSIQQFFGGLHSPPSRMVSQAHYGITFLDELMHFRRAFLDQLALLMDNEYVQSSNGDSVELIPCQTTCVATANPCACGFFGTASCHCSESEVLRYLKRIPGSLIDRFHISWRVTDQDVRSYSQQNWEAIKRRVNQARKKQLSRVQQGFPMYARQYTSEQIFQLVAKKKEHISRSWRKDLQQWQIAVTLADLCQEELSQSHWEQARLYSESAP